jgi:hypothetical protein
MMGSNIAVGRISIMCLSESFATVAIVLVILLVVT